MLSEFKSLVKQKFNLVGRYEDGQGFGHSRKYRAFHRETARFLHSIGTPKGSKVNKEFLVPAWIKENPTFSKSYLQVAFACEGGFWKENGSKRIRFGLAKNEMILDNGKAFMQDLRDMLKELNVDTTDIWVTKGNNRKDGKITKFMHFKVRQASIPQFLASLGFSDRFKNG